MIDASVLIGLLIGRAVAITTVGKALEGDGFEALYAPELIDVEVLHALRGMVRRGEITPVQASFAVSGLSAVGIVRHPHTYLIDRIWDLRHALTSYDASYLALAEAANARLLLTADAGLATVASNVLGSERVRLID